MIAEAKTLGAIELKSDGTMTYDFFLETSKLVYKYTHRMINVSLKTNVSKRRELLKEEKNAEYEEHALETTNW